MKQAEQFFIPPIDLVCVNLYPFEATIAKPGIQLEEAIEQIDIGGPSMVRSASKNWESVTVVVDPGDYEEVLEELKKYGGTTLRETRRRLAAKVFAVTSRYDAAICGYLESIGSQEQMPATFTLHGVTCARRCATAKIRIRAARRFMCSPDTASRAWRRANRFRGRKSASTISWI